MFSSKLLDKICAKHSCILFVRCFNSFLAHYVSSPMCLLFLQMQHFKEVEIAKVRMEEKAKFHKEFEKLKQELERTHEMKAKALMDREKNAIDRLQKQQEVNTFNKIFSFIYLFIF